MAISSWDDLRFLLAVSRAPSLSHAARTLGVDQTTVTRRMQAFEQAQGAKVFDRLRGGVELTPLGAQFVAAATEVETRLLGLERSAVGTQAEVAGPLRLTLPPTLAMGWVHALGDFARKYPAIVFELIVDDQVKNLTRREADVAVRYAKNPPGHLVGRKLGRLAQAVYGAPPLRDVPLDELPWIGWEPGLAEGAIEQFRRKYSPGRGYVMYANSMLVVIEAVRRAEMVTVLGCMTGDADPHLVRLTEPVVSDNPLWLLTHPDLQHSPRVRALMDHLAAFVSTQTDALLGRRPRA